jgi:hypothetical protein
MTWKSRGLYVVTLVTPFPDSSYAVVVQNEAPANPNFGTSNSSTTWISQAENGVENPMIVVNKQPGSFEVLCWSHEDNAKENTTAFSVIVCSIF